MSGSILHRRASGIHPGAFVQPTEPDSTDIQDGVFWLDTSAGPPYQLKRWDAGATAWHPVQMDATGYPLPLGDRLEEYSVGAVNDPLDPPILTAVAASFNLWPAGTYYFAYTWRISLLTGGEGHTALSPAGIITVDGTKWVRFCKPAFPSGFPTARYRGTNVYLIGPLPPVSDVWTGFLTSITSGDCYTLANLTDPDLPQAPTDNTTGHVAVRLVKASGSRYWDHDGSTLTVYSDDDTSVLQAPLPALANAPATLVGQDPASGLPAFCPVPRASSDLLTVPSAPTADVTTCVAMRCGVSASMTGHLLSLYSQWARWLNPLFQLIGTVAFAAMLANLEDLFIVGEVAATNAAIWAALKSTLSGLVSTITGGMLPFLDSDQQGAIQHPLFCVLTCDGGEVSVSTDQIDAWRTAVGALSIFTPGTVSQELLQALLQYTPLQDWQLAGHSSGPSTACAAWTCP